MAKNDKKPNPQPAEEKNSDIISAPEKVIDSPATESAKPTPHKPPHPQEMPHKKHGGWNKFVLFIILLSAGAVGFLSVQLRQTEKLNTEALNKLQANYEEKLNAVNNRVNALNQEVIGLKNRPIVEHAAGISENQLNQKLAAFRSELEQRFGLAPEADGKAPELPAINLVEPAAAPHNAKTAAEKTTQELLLASGAIIVRDLAEQGVNFAYEAEVLQILAQGNDLATENVRIIRNYADSGVLGKQKLIRNFHKIFTDLNNADLKAESAQKVETTATEDKWYRKVWNWLKKQVTAKKRTEKPKFLPQEDEVLALVDEGRLQDALEALKLSEKYAKINSEPLMQWRVQVEKYLKFNSAVSALIMNSLANIRLKEMEH